MGLVSGHQLSTFSSPVNGTSPIDANSVRGNDNSIGTAYNAHDADTTIHLQNSVLASRPAAGTAGRQWLTTDGLRVYYDTGSVWSEVAYLPLVGGTVTGATTFSALVTFSAGVAITGNSTLAGTLTSLTGITSSGTAAFAVGTYSSTLNVTGVTTLAALTASALVTLSAGLTVSAGTSAFQAVTATSVNTTGTTGLRAQRSGGITQYAQLDHEGGIMTLTARNDASISFPPCNLIQQNNVAAQQTVYSVGNNGGISFGYGFGCNGNAAQTKAVSGGTLAGVISALVANGILSS